MSDSSYSVDDILKEVRKRREESEAKIKGETSDEPYAEQENSAPLTDAGESTENDTQQETINNDEKEYISEEDDQKQEPEKSGEQNQVQSEIFRSFQEAEDGKVDLLSLSVHDENIDALTAKKKKWSQTKTGKIIISVIVILLVLVVCAGVYAYYYINNALNSVTDNHESQPVAIEEWQGMDVLTENFDPVYEDSKANISSLRDMIKKWYYNGIPCSSSHVLNVLLIGVDTRDTEIEDEGTRADSAIIASVNIDTGEIILTSILRDSYAYWETVEGDKSTGQFGKINGAMSTGGTDCYIRCVENMFKVNIDNYAIVNFDSFEGIVDTLGGVTIEMTASEIKEINNHQKRYGYVTIDGDPGLLELDGKQALAYCRIRHIDSDAARADRQKTVLLQLFDKMQDASAIKSAEVVNTLLPYVKTGFSKNELVSIGKYAIKNGWLNYKTKTQTVPSNNTNDDGSVITTCKGGNYYGAWVWKVDYPLSAQILQTNIYGKTNIVLADKRPKFTEISDYS